VTIRTASEARFALPTDWGAGNWNTGAFDPETGMYYAVSMTQPIAFGLIKATNPAATMAYSEPGGGGGGGAGGGQQGRQQGSSRPGKMLSARRMAR